MSGPRYVAGLNANVPLSAQLERQLARAEALDVAVAYAKSSGVGQLLRLGVPRQSRAVVGLGFGLTDPVAVDQLLDAGVEVRAVADRTDLSTSQFHPKLYVIHRPGEVVVLSGSGNLTGGGLTTNVEQYEELTFTDPSAEADVQRGRFDQLWRLGTSIEDLRRTDEWDAYRARVRERRQLEQADRRRLLRLAGSVERIIGGLARRETRRAPAYLAITHQDWWTQVLAQRAVADRALFWRRRTERFEALATGGVFLHLVRSPDGREENRAVQGFSIYPGVFEVAPVEDAWRRYGELLGVYRLRDVYERLEIDPGRSIGIIHLENVTELDRPVTLAELRANDIDFARNIVSGRTLRLEELATLLELGGMGAPSATVVPAGEPTPPFRVVSDEDARPYENCVPLVSLAAAAGGFGDVQDVEVEAWVAPAGRTRPGPGMFVAQVVGKSMNRRIPDGVYCLFRSPVEGSRTGRVLLVQHRDISDPDHGGTYTVKVYESTKSTTASGEWEHTEIRLRPDSLESGYAPIVLRPEDEHDVRVIAELVEVLTGAPPVERDEGAS